MRCTGRNYSFFKVGWLQQFRRPGQLKVLLLARQPWPGEPREFLLGGARLALGAQHRIFTWLQVP
jgi:hypothetical protein